ncbi:MAG: stage III sporulation protein AC [Clostridiales bacterium]|jgi:stage III sporulation protein AC|nr:stage III sporulation protein AC [Clostridiales bacterium]
MNVDLIFKIGAVGIIVAILHTLLTKSGREEQAMMIVLAGLVVVMLVMAKEIVNLFNTLKSLFNL